ncbi:MAG: sulfatase [Planctomycetota bacterium]
MNIQEPTAKRHPTGPLPHLPCLGNLCLGLSILLGTLGCAEQPGPKPRLVRLADSRYIESVKSSHEPILENECSVFDEKSMLALVDSNSDWYPFLVSAELSDEPEETGESYADTPRNIENHRIVIPPETGIAAIVPVEPGTRLFVECRGRFLRAEKCAAYFLQMTARPELPSAYHPGKLGVMIKHFGIGEPSPLITANDGGSASKTIDVEDNAQALLILVAAFGSVPGALEQARVDAFSARQEFLLFRRKHAPPHPAIAMNPFIGGILKPSLFLPGNTTISTIEMEIPRGAGFRCSLGLIGSGEGPVSFLLNAYDEKNRKITILSHIVPESEKGWIDLEQSLDSISGGMARLEFSSVCASPEQAASPAPPLLFCGSPMICSQATPAGDSAITRLILISLDTLRPDHLGCYGYERPVSPVIDRLAGESVLFERAYSQAPYTLPSHTTLFTSLYPTVHGMHFHDYAPAKLEFMAEILAENGMATASFNSSGYLSREFGLQQGFDLYCEVDPIGDRYLDGDPFNTNRLADGSAGSLDPALSWIQDRKDEPFFLFLHTFMIHDYIPPRDLAEQFNEGGESHIRLGKEAIGRLTTEYLNNPGLSQAELDYFINMYDAGIRAADEMIGRLLSRLETLGIRDETLIVIVSDHGEEFLEHGSVRHSNTVYEELIRVPLLFSVPGRTEGLRLDPMVNLVDVMPTILELLQIEPPPIMQGRSLVPLMEGRTMEDRPVFAETQLPERSLRFCIIQNKWKYIEGSTDSSLSYPAPAAEQLFNLEDDPHEKNDSKDQDPKRKGNLKQYLDRLRKDLRELQEALGTGAGGDNEISDELRERLQQQGYL